VLLWRWHACKHPIFGLRVVSPVQGVTMGLHAAAFPALPAPKLGFPQSVKLMRITVHVSVDQPP